MKFVYLGLVASLLICGCSGGDTDGAAATKDMIIKAPAGHKLLGPPGGGGPASAKPAGRASQ